MSALSTHRPLVLAAVMAANFMIAIEATIVSTAMPQIAADLGGLGLYSWVFAAFLLTQTATTVLFGKLSDLRGRKTVMLAGIVIFLVGSLLCGLAPGVPELIAARVIQAAGAGLMVPASLSLVLASVPAAMRGQAIGTWSAVAAMGAAPGQNLAATGRGHAGAKTMAAFAHDLARLIGALHGVQAPKMGQKPRKRAGSRGLGLPLSTSGKEGPG